MDDKGLLAALKVARPYVLRVAGGEGTATEATIAEADLNAIDEAVFDTRPTADLGEDGEWQPIETAPYAMHFLAAYFYEEAGEWVYDVATMHHDHVCGANEGSGPFTHWMPLPKPPR